MLIITTALYAEAKPIICHFSLKKIVYDTPFPIFRKGNIYLIISGIGKEKMLMALSFIKGLFRKSSAFLNVGLAGHRCCEQGKAFLISKIEDFETKEVFYPIFLDRYEIPTSSLISVNTPEKKFEKEALYDMEGSAYFKAASFFATAELIHTIKIISDNRNCLFQKDQASLLIEKNIQLIERVVFSLEKELSKLPPSVEVAPIAESVHFTETQRHQLKEMLYKLKLYSAQEILQFFKKIDF